MSIIDFKDSLFKKGKDIGFGDMEIYYSKNKTTRINVLKKKVESCSINEDAGVLFRGIYNGKIGYSYTEKIDEYSVDFLLNVAKSNSEAIEMIEKYELFEGADKYESLKQHSLALEDTSIEKLTDAALKMENYALNDDSRVIRVIQSIVEKQSSEISIINTKGLNCHSKQNAVFAYVYLMASDGKDTTTGLEYDLTIKDFSEIDVKKIAKKAVDESINKLGSDSINSGMYPVIFRNDTAKHLLNSFVSSLSGETVEKGLSKLDGKLNQKIVGSNISIIDDPLMEGTIGAKAFDAEGYPTRKVEIVKDGKLLEFLHNRKTALKAGTVSTGNASKKEYKSDITVGPNNVYLKPGKEDVDSIIKKTENGLFIIELQGMHTGINTVSGDFSLPASGFLIENGVITKPVNQIVIAGNIFELLNNIDEIANDLNIKSPVSCPTIKVKSLSIAGK